MAVVLCTHNLRLRQAQRQDAAFLLALLNEPDFMQNIGDRQVRSLAQAELYIQKNFQHSYQTYGFGLWVIERLSDNATLGLCGLVQRDYLPQPDLGYALMKAYSGQGYISEAAVAVVAYARDELNLQKLCAIVAPDNWASKRILTKVGMQAAGQIQLPDSAKNVDFYRMDLS